MRATVDSAGRVLLPTVLRDELGLTAGSPVDLSRFGSDLAPLPGSRTARLVQADGATVVTGETSIDDDTVFGLVDAGRR